jgi:hypothetical protein
LKKIKKEIGKMKKLSKADQEIIRRVDERLYNNYMDSLLEGFIRTLQFLEYKGDKMAIMQLRNLFTRKIEQALKRIEERA